ncbi:hypothetical protein [Aeromonas tecta]|uniref:hypothetical protein n=1 Tax=Aeromonas tecta TaxID=324617 RepID=UPI000682AD8F|nr:hypothetical protein [Aeromonas tecta]
MFELIEKAMAHLQSGNYAILIAVIIASLIYKSFPLLDAYHAHRKRRVTDLENTIKSDNISSSFKKNLKEEIESEHFKIVYGVRAKKSLIDQVFMLHNKLGGERTLHQFSNALKLYPKVIRGSDGKYKLEVRFIDFFFGLYHLFFGFIFLALGLLVLYIQIDLGLFALNGRPLILIAIMIIGGIYLFYMGTPVFSLRAINRALKTRS